MERTIYSPDPARIGALKDREAVELFRDLLWCDAVRLGLRNIVISLDTTVADGGIDATADMKQSSDGESVSGSFHFQIKAGKAFKPWQDSQVRKELFGTKGIRSKKRLGHAVRRCLDGGGTYVLVAFGHDLSSTNHAAAVDLFTSHFRACGYRHSSVQVCGQGQLVKLLEPYPSLCLDLSNRGNTSFQTLKSWASNSDMTPRLELGEPQRRFEQELRDLIRGDEIQHVRVIGEPGIGKTRLVLESIRSEEDLAARCVYVPQAGTFQNNGLFNELLKPDREYWVLLVIDECDPIDRASIWSALKGRKRVKIITIDHGPENSADDAMRTLQFPPLEQAQIEAILHAYIPSSDLFNWAAWCGGSARVAHAVGENLKRNPDDLLKEPATVPIWDRFITGYRRREGADSERLRVIMRHIALFRKFGFKPPVAEEGQYIASMAAQVDGTISGGRFSSDVKKYCDRRILQGSHTLRIVPKALHVHLWKEWWENYGATADLASMMEGMPRTLHRWFLDMFIYANGVDAAQRAVRRVLSTTDGPFSDKRFLTSESGTRFIETLAEADPAATIALLQATIGRWPPSEVDGWQTGRQNIVFALEKIAVWREHFRSAATILGRMALADQSTNSNNSKGTLLGLFELRGGPTQAPPDARLNLARSWLGGGDERERRLGVEACGAVLNLHGITRIVGVEYQGLMAEIEFWAPKIYDDLFVPRRQAMAMLMEQNKQGDPEWKLVTSREIIRRADEMLAFNFLPDEALDVLHELANDPANDIQSLTQHVISRLRITPDVLAPTVLDRLRRLEDTLGSGPFSARLQRFVIFQTWDEDYTYNADGDIEESPVPDERLAALAQELLNTPALLEEHLPMLLQSEGFRIVKFGRHVALAAGAAGIDATIFAATKPIESSVKYGFVCGYLMAVREIDSARWETLALQMLQETAHGKWRAIAVDASGSSPAIFAKLLALYQEGAIDSAHFERVGQVGRHDDNSLGEVETVLRALLARPDQHSHRVAVRIASRRFCLNATAGRDPEDVVWQVLTQTSNFVRASDGMDEHYWTDLAKRFRQRFPRHDLELLSIIIRRTGSRPSLRAVGSMHETAAEICMADPKGAWSILAGDLARNTNISSWSLRRWLGDTGLRSNPARPLVECFDPDDIVQWVDEDLDARLRLVIEFAPKTLATGPSGELSRRLIGKYGDNDLVRDSLIGHFDTGTFFGPRSERFAERRELARSWLTVNASAAVQAWLERYIDILGRRIEDARIEEERTF